MEMTVKEEFQSPIVYPRWKFHPDGSQKLVNDPGAEARLGMGWYNSPAEFPERPKEETDGNEAACPQCAAMKEKFDAAWQRMNEEYHALREKYEGLAGEQASAGAQPESTESDGIPAEKRKGGRSRK
jgi:hypothetical protein